MSDQPLVSIIIPTYNRAHLIGETLDSVLAQTYQNWECIVVDDGSTDDTDALMANYMAKDARFKYYHRPKNRLPGGNAARNYGFEQSKGEYIQWFDSDDLMHAKKLDIQLSQLSKVNFNYSICQSAVFNVDTKGKLELRHPLLFSEKPFEDYLMMRVIFMTPSVLWKRNFLTTSDTLFDESLKAGQEWEFHCRMLSKDSTYGIVPQTLVYLRKHSGSISYNINYLDRFWNYLLARQKVLELDKVKESRYLRNYIFMYNFKLFKRLVLNKYQCEDGHFLRQYLFSDNGLLKIDKLRIFLLSTMYIKFGLGYSVVNKLKPPNIKDINI